MTTSCKDWTPIDALTHERLQRDFLPRLEQMKHDRRRDRNIMVGLLLCIPIVALVSGVLLLVRFWGGEDVRFLGALAWAVSSLGGSLAVTYVWMGKLRACEDDIVFISGRLCLGYMEPILDSIEHIACYSKFKGLINDVQRVVSRPKDPGAVPGGSD